MATFRSSVVVSCIAVALACAPPAATSDAASVAAAAVQSRPAIIDPVAPARDAVGPSPARLEWTAVAGADRYEIVVWNDIDAVMFEHEDVRATTLALPAEARLMAGTYFWRVTAVRDGRLVGDSGRSAFVVRD